MGAMRYFVKCYKERRRAHVGTQVLLQKEPRFSGSGLMRLFFFGF